MKAKYRVGRAYKKMKSTSSISGVHKTKAARQKGPQVEPKTMVVDAGSGKARMVRL